MLRLLAAACIALLLSLPARSALIEFDFTNTAFASPLGLSLGNIGNSVPVSSGGLSATLNGFSHINIPTDLHRLQCCGLGVVGGPNGNSVGSREAIEVAFDSPALAISAFILEGGPSDGSLNFFVDGNLEKVINWQVGGGTFEVEPLDGAVGSVFRFEGVKRGFRLTALTVQRVPEPGSLALWACGFLAFILARATRIATAIPLLRNRHRLLPGRSPASSRSW